MLRKILYVEGCRDGTVGGSHSCLYSMVANLDRTRFHPAVVFYNEQFVAEKLENLGVEICVFENKMPLDINLLLNRLSPLLGKVSRVLLPLQKGVNFFWYFSKPVFVYVRYLKKNCIDIVHLNNSMNTNHEWMLAAKLAGAKLISHERGISDKLSLTSRLLGGSADYIICMSEIIRKPIIKQGLNKYKTVVIYDGIDVSNVVVKQNPEFLRSIYGIRHNDPIIGVVGNIKQWKGQETVIRATAILKKTWHSIKCLLVGGSGVDDPYKKKLEKLINELDVDRNVIFTGFQTNPADYINMMDVVVHASILPEPFGMVNLEAMYMKKPVISTNMGGPTEIFDNGENGILIEPANPVLLAEKLSLLLGDLELRKKISTGAYKTVMEKFTISNTVRQVEKLYDELCPQR